MRLFPEDSDPDLKLSVCNNRRTCDVIATRLIAAKSKDVNVSHSSFLFESDFSFSHSECRYCITLYFQIFICLRKRQCFSIAEYLGIVENSDYARSQPICLYFQTRLAISGGPSGPDRDGPGTREIPRETRRKVPT